MLYLDPAYQDLTDEEREQIADRIDDFAPHDFWGSAFPMYAHRTNERAIRLYQEYRARRDVAPLSSAVTRLPRAA